MDEILNFLPDSATSALVVAGLGLAAILVIRALIRSALSMVVKVAASLGVLGAGGGMGSQVLSRIDVSQLGAGVGGLVAALGGGWLLMTLLDEL